MSTQIPAGTVVFVSRNGGVEIVDVWTSDGRCRQLRNGEQVTIISNCHNTTFLDNSYCMILCRFGIVSVANYSLIEKMSAIKK